MPTHKPGKIQNGQDGLAFANALRDCLDCGLAEVDLESGSITFNGEAAEMLELGSASGRKVPLDSLPAPLGEAIRECAGGTASIARTRRIGAIARIVEVQLPKHGSVTLGLEEFELPRQTARLLAIRDLTPLRRMEQKIWRLDRLANLGTLSASMAHEIKNALVAGKTFIDLLLERHKDAELVDIVRREIGRIDSIVSRMLSFVGQAKPAYAPVNLHASLEHSLRLAQPQLESKAIVLTRSFLAAPEMVEGDGHELQQAFVNLFLNALEAMGPNGTLAVATERIDTSATTNGAQGVSTPQLLVTIKDSGPGIAPANMEQLFEAFFTTKPSGTGLGLSITQRIIHEHRGEIEVESQVGEGTTFRITLPGLG